MQLLYFPTPRNPPRRKSASPSTKISAAAARTTASCARFSMLAEKPTALSDARRLSQRVHFERDGTVTIASGKVELGQGILTALAQIAAEELDVPLERIRMLPASTAHSPDEGVTSGSQSIQDGGKALRIACAELRALLLGRACRHLRLPLEQLQVIEGKIRGAGK